MSQGETVAATTTAEDATIQVEGSLGLKVTSANLFGSSSRPPSINEISSDSSSSEDEGESSEARRRWKEKMNAKNERRAQRLYEKKIKEEKDKYPFLWVS